MSNTVAANLSNEIWDIDLAMCNAVSDSTIVQAMVNSMVITTPTLMPFPVQIGMDDEKEKHRQE